MNDIDEMLEFNQIREWLKEAASGNRARERFEKLVPFLDQDRAMAAILETTEARKALDAFGMPPVGSMDGVRETVQQAARGRLLSAEELNGIRQFAVLCTRLVRYLKRCGQLTPGIAAFGGGISELTELQEEIERCIRGDRVEDHASRTLALVRRKLEQTEEQIRVKLDGILRGNKAYFGESFVSTRNGHYTLPVRKECKGKVPGSVIDISSTGATLFIEPAAVGKLTAELDRLKTEEENEEKIILYTLSAMTGDRQEEIFRNLEYMEELDYIFAKGKLSSSMGATAPRLNTDRRIEIRNGRHPLLTGEKPVPLNIRFGEDTRGVIITGPNTGGKTVALKTVGLLSVMAQCGLHVPCEEADLAMHADVFCDIGDGQSIHENLSTFSSHIKNVIRILEKADEESLVLMDELGSGTDPAEGMGIAVAVLEELRNRGCLFLVTTHYPEVKEYGNGAEGVINARMAFDRESLQPLYRLELGESGESCAFHIARRLGMPERLLDQAAQAAYGSAGGRDRAGGQEKSGRQMNRENPGKECQESGREILRDKSSKADQKKSPENRQERHREKPHRILSGAQEREKDRKQEEISEKFHMGDSVMVYPQRKIGIVFAPANEKGDVGVQIQRKKCFVNYKRLQLKVAADRMYPPDYDFSIVFDTVSNRKVRHQMERKYVPGVEIQYENGKEDLF